jgi:hypothetical protein
MAAQVNWTAKHGVCRVSRERIKQFVSGLTLTKEVIYNLQQEGVVRDHYWGKKPKGYATEVEKLVSHFREEYGTSLNEFGKKKQLRTIEGKLWTGKMPTTLYKEAVGKVEDYIRNHSYVFDYDMEDDEYLETNIDMLSTDDDD